MITALILAASLDIGAAILSGTKWTQITHNGGSETVECPILFEFVGSKYRYINECSGKGGNKVVEFGNYEVGTGSILLTDRRVVVGAGSVFGEDAKPVSLEIVRYESTSMTLGYGGSVLTLDMAGQVEW